MFGSSINSQTAFISWPRDQRVQDPLKDSVSCLKFAPVTPSYANGNDVLAVGSWDGSVRIYQVTKPAVGSYIETRDENSARQAVQSGFAYPQAQKVLEYQHDGQGILDVAWYGDGTKVVSGGCDGTVQVFDVQTSQKQQVYKHNAPVKCVHVFQMNGGEVIASAAWDKKVHYVFTANLAQGIVRDLSQRPISMDSNGHFLIIALAERRMHVVILGQGANLEDPSRTYEYESPLKWQTRVVRCFPKTDAIALGTIEGRVAINYPLVKRPNIQQAVTDTSYTFRCHRHPLNPQMYNPDGTNRAGAPGTTQFKPDAKDAQQHVFHVNAIAFHRENETFATGGGDGTYTFWNGIARSKLKTYTARDVEHGVSIQKYTREMGQWKEPVPLDAEPGPLTTPLSTGLPIVGMTYNPSGSVMAIARSYDWSKGYAYAPAQDAAGNFMDQATAPHILLKLLVEGDMVKTATVKPK